MEIFTGCSSMQFFNLLPSTKTVSEAAKESPPLTVQHLCDLQDAISLQWLPSASHPNPCLGKQRTALGVANISIMGLFSHGPLLN